MNRALRATTGNALRMHWVRCGGCADAGTEAIHQDTPAEIPRQQPSRLTRAARPSHQKTGHRVIAQVVPRAGVVNARRPGREPGRSVAKSIDDAEHGARIKHAMVQAQQSVRACVARILEKWVRGLAMRACICRLGCLKKHDHDTGRRGPRFLLTNSLRRHMTHSTTNDGVNDPVWTAWGHPRGTTPGSFTPSLVQRLRYGLR